MEENVNTQGFISRLFSFEGRAKRMEYWIAHICSRLAMTPVKFDEFDYTIGWMLYLLIVLLPVSWAFYAVAVRRFHDLGRSGWFAVLLCIPFANIVAAIYAAFFKGQEEDNKYGLNPYHS
jgi:uncharacterized membrane protein YhaH (DUF805 family)